MAQEEKEGAAKEKALMPLSPVLSAYISPKSETMVDRGGEKGGEKRGERRERDDLRSERDDKMRALRSSPPQRSGMYAIVF